MRAESFTFCKAQASEQFDNMETDMLEIPHVGPVQYTPEYLVHKTFLTSKEKPAIWVEARAAARL